MEAAWKSFSVVCMMKDRGRECRVKVRSQIGQPNASLSLVFTRCDTLADCAWNRLRLCRNRSIMPTKPGAVSNTSKTDVLPENIGGFW